MMHMERHKQQQRPHYIRNIMNFLQGIAFTIFLFTIILTIYLIIIYHTRLTPFINYAIVFDAGSSHTEMFIYSWPADKSQGLGTTSTVDEVFVCPVAGITINGTKKHGESPKLKAISDFEDNLDLLKDYFRPCLTNASSKIPSNRHKFSPVFLGATAGMRLALLRNETKAKQVLESIREIFSNTPFQFVVNRQVRILTGMEEAIDGWITTNILLEKFKHKHAQKTTSQRIKSQTEFDQDMVGVLDLGGASTQVTFTHTKTDNDTSIPDEFITNITLFDTVYNPYAISYLCWGKNEASKRHRARLLNAAINFSRIYDSNSSHILIRDPCLARGTNDTFTFSSLFRSTCTADEKQKFIKYINKTSPVSIGAGNASQCGSLCTANKIKKLNNDTNKISFVFVGVGNANRCLSRVVELFDAKRNNATDTCSFKQENCTFNDTSRPPIPSNIDFIGLSGYYYVFHNLAFGMSKFNGLSLDRYELKDFKEDEIRQRLVNVCETPYPRLYEQESMKPDTEQHKRNLCFDAWYMWVLLTCAIGFNENDLKRLSFANRFPTGKVGWTLGYMINQTNYIPAEYREKLLTQNSFIGWLTGSLTFALISFIFLLLTCYIYCKPKTTTTTANNKDNYGHPNDHELA